MRMYVLVQRFKIGAQPIEIVQDGLRGSRCRRVHSYHPSQHWWISVKASAGVSDRPRGSTGLLHVVVNRDQRSPELVVPWIASCESGPLPSLTLDAVDRIQALLVS